MVAGLPSSNARHWPRPTAADLQRALSSSRSLTVVHMDTLRDDIRRLEELAQVESDDGVRFSTHTVYAPPPPRPQMRLPYP